MDPLGPRTARARVVSGEDCPPATRALIRAVPCNGYDRLEGLHRVLACPHLRGNGKTGQPNDAQVRRASSSDRPRRRPGSYRIVATGPAGEALGRFKLPFSDIELENFILKVGSTRRGRRRIDSPEMELAKTFGTKLFGALFEGDVRELYRSSFAESRADGQGLRVTLSLTGAPELLQVPWEYLYDHPSFLSISTWTPIVRYLDLPKPRRPLQIDAAAADPRARQQPVGLRGDRRRAGAGEARSALGAAHRGRARSPSTGSRKPACGRSSGSFARRLPRLPLHRSRRLRQRRRRRRPAVRGRATAAGDGSAAIQLGTILADEVSLRLAVLNSCEGARSSLQDPFSGVATSLIELEIPAVIGMQFEITDRAAIVFGGEFYSALADGLAVDAASPRRARRSTPTRTTSSGGRRSCSCASPTAGCSTSRLIHRSVRPMPWPHRRERCR